MSREPPHGGGGSGFDEGDAGVFAVGAFGGAQGGMAPQEIPACGRGVGVVIAKEDAPEAAGLALAAVALNAITTGDHLIKTVFTDTYWPVAGVDLSLLAVAGTAAWAARTLARREHRVALEAARPAAEEAHV